MSKNLPWQEWALKKKQGKCFERPAYIYVWKQTMSPIEIQQPIFLRMHMWLIVLYSCVYLESTQHLQWWLEGVTSSGVATSLTLLSC